MKTKNNLKLASGIQIRVENQIRLNNDSKHHKYRETVSVISVLRELDRWIFVGFSSSRTFEAQSWSSKNCICKQ